MLNYIKAEIYRNFNRIYFLGYTSGIAILALTFNILLKVSNNNGNMDLSNIFAIVMYMLGAGMFLILPILDMSTAEEQKNQTFKNVVSFGISKSKLVLSKIIVAVILSFITAIIILIVFLGSGAILFGTGGNFTLDILSTFSIRLLVSILLWIGAVSIGTFLAFFFKSNTVFSFAYMGVFLITNKIIKLLAMLVSDKFNHMSKFLITTQFDKLSNEIVTNDTLIFASGIGIAYIIIFTILGILYVERMDVK